MGCAFFTKQIRTLRKKAGYTQEDVSRLLNIQRQTYCNYENGTRMPPLEIIIALAEVYQISVDALVRETPEEHPAVSPTPSTAEAKLLHDFSSLSSPKQKEVFEFIQFKKQLPD